MYQNGTLLMDSMLSLCFARNLSSIASILSWVAWDLFYCACSSSRYWRIIGLQWMVVNCALECYKGEQLCDRIKVYIWGRKDSLVEGDGV